MWPRSHRVRTSTLNMTLLMAVCISGDGDFSLAVCSMEAVQFGLKQEGVATKEPQPYSRTSCCWLLREIGRVQQEGLVLRNAFSGHFIGPAYADWGSFSLKIADVSVNLQLTSFPVSGSNFIWLHAKPMEEEKEKTPWKIQRHFSIWLFEMYSVFSNEGSLFVHAD